MRPNCARSSYADGRWAETIAAQIEELSLFAEACDLFRAEAEVDGRELSLAAALESVDWNFSRDPERVIIAWDAAKKLIASFQQPRFAQLPEVQAIEARYRETERRIDTELRPLLDRLAIDPLLRTATDTVDRLRRAIDSQDDEGALAARRELRVALAPLQRYAAVADVDEIVGLAPYTPQREVRDNDGRVLGTVDGAPCPVPRVVIRGVATTYFVVTPGHPPSLDAMDEADLVA